MKQKCDKQPAERWRRSSAPKQCPRIHFLWPTRPTRDDIKGRIFKLQF